LSRPQKRLHQRTLSTDNHSRKTFEPPTFRNFRLGNEPIRELTELISRDFSVSDSIEVRAALAY